MQLLWEETIGRGEISERDYKGHAVWLDSRPVFLFRDEKRRIIGAELSGKGIERLSPLTDRPIDSKPEHWLLVEQPPLLMVSRDLGFDLLSGRVLDLIPPEYARDYQRKVTDRDMHLEYDGFDFGDHEISRRGRWGYDCRSHGEVLWSLTAQGYLYTDMVLIDDRLLFGTDGQGGHFYIVELTSGDPVCDINTHGTNCFVVRDGSAYVLERGKKSAVLEISIRDGSVRDRIPIRGRATVESPLALCGDKLLFVSFGYRELPMADRSRPGRTRKLPVTEEAILGCIRL